MQDDQNPPREAIPDPVAELASIRQKLEQLRPTLQQLAAERRKPAPAEAEPA